MLSCVTLTWNINHHAFSYACRNLYLDNFLALNDSATAAFLTLVLDNGAFAIACGTFRQCLHHAQHGVRTVRAVTTPLP